MATEADIVALGTEVPGIGLVSPEYSRTEQVASKDRVCRARLSGVLSSYGAMRLVTPMPGGRFLNGRIRSKLAA